MRFGSWTALPSNIFMWKKNTAGRGYGSQLLERIEQQARAAGAKRIFLNTFSFQAPAFYEKHGYQLFAKLEPAMANYNQYFFQKLLDLE